MTTTQLLGTREYCYAIVTGRANISLSYLSRDGAGNPVERLRRVGVRWFESGVVDGAPWVVRLVVDNCGMSNEYPVFNIVSQQGAVADTDDANEILYAAIGPVQQGTVRGRSGATRSSCILRRSISRTRRTS